ncbi:MAG: CdaR family transcriptional regulator [Ruthenibacterium lactatiformans]
MELSVQSAQRIVDEISGIVGQHINMMDERGNIIASTDGTRVGHFHAGAKRIVEEGLPELYVRPEDATPTVRAGLNLPITHGGRTVGVIGITGAYEQVIGYGQVVKKMTEILIREGNEQDEKRLDQRVRSRFLEDWVLGGGLLQPQVLAERGLALGVDITVPRRVMVVSVRDLALYTDTAAGQKRIDQLETAVSGLVEGEAGGIILRNARGRLRCVRGRTLRCRPWHSVCGVMARERFGLRLAVGIDGGAPDVHRAYAQANKAWRSARMAPEGVLPYDSVTLELFTGDVPRQTKEEYLRKVFRGCTYEELRRWIGLLEAYFAAEGSIQAAADALYIHKNTLQYRLKRLEELTGCDVRRPSQAPVFYMAVLFFKEVEGSLLLMGS